MTSRVIPILNMKKALFVVLGFIFLGIGIAGTVLPLLPGGPFYLLASYCFAKSSERFDNWFKGTIFYRKYVLAFLLKKGLTLKEKIRINLIADAFIIFSLFKVDILWVRISIVAVALYKYYYFIWKIKTIKPGEDQPETITDQKPE